MGLPSRSTGVSRRTTGVARDDAPRELRRRGRSWPWFIVLVGLGLLKGQALATVLHHRLEVIVLLGVALAVSMLRARPIWVAATAAPLLAFALAPRSTAVGIAIGLGSFVLLLGLFFGIATVLHARQDHRADSRAP